MKLNLLLALGASALLFVGSTAAQDAAPPPEAPPAVAAPAPRIAAGAVVNVATTEVLSSIDAKVGDKVGLTLTAPLMLGDREILPAGTKGVAEVVSANPKGNAGRPGEIVVAARSLDADGVVIPLKGLQMTVKGRDLSKASMWAMGTVKGSEVEMPVGTAGDARLAADLVVGEGGLQVVADAGPVVAEATGPAADVVPGKVKAPLPGKGRIVFFREAVFLAGGYPVDIRTGPDFTVKLGTLTSGQYLVVDAEPGVHLFSSLKKDGGTVRIEVEAGQTYFVRGVAIGFPAFPPTSITSSDRETFVSMSGSLRAVKGKRK
jgi:hypothetical protein